MKPTKSDSQFVGAFRDSQTRKARLKRLCYHRLLSRLGAYLVLFALITDIVPRFVFENEAMGIRLMLVALLAMLFTICLHADIQIKVLMTESDREQQGSGDNA